MYSYTTSQRRAPNWIGKSNKSIVVKQNNSINDNASQLSVETSNALGNFS